MSTAIVSSPFYESIGDVLFKNNLNKQIKRDVGKAVGSPIINSTTLFRTSSTGGHAPLSPKLSSPILSSNTFSNGPSDFYLKDHRKLDRSLSEPVDRQNKINQQQQQAATNSSRYKTELCRPFEENGTCKYGDKCQFAHGSHELRNLARHPKYKTELCRTFHTIGFCPYGPRCHFIHNPDESRKSSSPPASPTSNGPSSVQSITSSTNSIVQSHQSLRQSNTRPKALSVGSFNSLGSTGDPSPPSSLSESPTSFGSFFTEEASVFSPSPSTPSAQNAFSFSHDFTPFMPSANNRQSRGQINNKYSQLNATNRSMPLSDLENNLFLDHVYNTIHTFDQTSVAQPPSPVDSLGSELDNLSLSDGVPACPSPLDNGQGLQYSLLNRISCDD